jgi:hypothetical protein
MQGTVPSSRIRILASSPATMPRTVIHRHVANGVVQPGRLRPGSGRENESHDAR